VGTRAGEEERERERRPAASIDLARSKAPWGRRDDASRGGSEEEEEEAAGLLPLGRETGEMGTEGGEPRRLRLLLVVVGGSHVGCRFLVKGMARSEWMMWLRGGARGDGELGWKELKERRSGGRRLRCKTLK
jgi:hypothetical protein